MSGCHLGRCLVAGLYRRHRIARLALFGSVRRDDFADESDVAIKRRSLGHSRADFR